MVFFHDSHGFGGMEFYLLRLIRHLDPARYQPAVMVPGFTDEYRSSSPRFTGQVQAMGLSLLKPAHPRDAPLIGAVEEIASMAQILRSQRADLLHIHTCRPEGARKATLAARLARVAGVVRSEHFPPAITTRRISKYLVKPFDWQTDFVITGSEGDRRQQIELLGRPASKVRRIYNSVELDQLDPRHDPYQAKLALGLDPARPVIGSVGRLAVQKGHRYLIEALPEVLRRFGPATLLLVGDGELRTGLEALTRRLGVEEFVCFAGFQEDVLPYMQATDIAVMPSLFEVFSLAMLEFMALGKPVVASNHSSFQEAIVDGENGLLVRVKDSQALAQAILTLLENRPFALALGKAGLERVQANFGFRRLADEMMELYDEVLKRT